MPASQTASCPGDNTIARLDTLISRAVGGGEPSAGHDISVEVNWLGTDNFYTQGASAALADALLGDTFEAEILVKNNSNDVIRSVGARRAL